MLLPQFFVFDTVAGMVCHFLSQFGNLTFVLGLGNLEISIVLFLNFLHTARVAALFNYPIFLSNLTFVEHLNIFKLLLPVC